MTVVAHRITWSTAQLRFSPPPLLDPTPDPPALLIEPEEMQTMGFKATSVRSVKYTALRVSNERLSITLCQSSQSYERCATNVPDEALWAG